MALEANRKDTTQTRGLVILISNILCTHFVYSQIIGIYDHFWKHIMLLLLAQFTKAYNI